MNHKQKGILYLVPKTISDGLAGNVIPHHVLEISRTLKFFIAEDERTARRYLSSIKPLHPISEIKFFTLNKHTKSEELKGYMTPLEDGNDMGLMSEAGVPAVADPGAVVVAIAHRMGCRVVPLVGPSSILLALMASGLNGQNFAFNGYLPIEKSLKEKQIRFFENRAISGNQSQIFIETPFRNDKLFSDLLKICRDETMLCIASDITGPGENIKTRPIGEWKKERPLLEKQPAIFIIGKAF